eukprot:361747-Chlamydomonas_euryale.AAC.10
MHTHNRVRKTDVRSESLPPASARLLPPASLLLLHIASPSATTSTPLDELGASVTRVQLHIVLVKLHNVGSISAALWQTFNILVCGPGQRAGDLKG